MGNGGQTGGVQLLAQLLQIVVAVHQLLADAADQDLVGDAPEHDGGVVVVLHNQLGELVAAVLMRLIGLLEHADKRDLCPDSKAQLVAGIVEVLAVLIVCQTDGVGAQLLDDQCILIVLIGGQSVALIHPVLMAGDTAQRGSHAPLLKKPPSGVTLKLRTPTSALTSS